MGNKTKTPNRMRTKGENIHTTTNSIKKRKVKKKKKKTQGNITKNVQKTTDKYPQNISNEIDKIAYVKATPESTKKEENGSNQETVESLNNIEYERYEETVENASMAKEEVINDDAGQFDMSFCTVFQQPTYQPQYDVDKLNALVRRIRGHPIYGDIILTKYIYTENIVVFNNLFQQNQLFHWKVDESKNEVRLMYKGTEIVKSHDISEEGEKYLKNKAIEKLSDHCFTIVTKFRSEDLINVNIEKCKSVKLKCQAPEPPPPEPPKDLNIYGSFALKMMSKMGWQGGGLGVTEQGRKDIIETECKNNRNGLGQSNENHNDFVQVIKDMLLEYAKTVNINSIVIPPVLDDNQRKHIHAFVRRNNLKSVSFGGKKRRFMAISHKLSKEQILEELLKIGGESKEHKLICPNNYKQEFIDINFPTI